MKKQMSDMVYGIRKKNSRAKLLTVHFNRLKPYLQLVIGESTDGQTSSEKNQKKEKRLSTRR